MQHGAQGDRDGRWLFVDTPTIGAVTVASLAPPAATLPQARLPVPA